VSHKFDKLIWENKNLPNKTTENEDIILVVREDLALLILKAIGLYLVFFAMLFFRLIVNSLNDYVWVSLYDTAMYTLAAVLTVVFLMIFHNYYLSLQIITSARVIDIDQVSLFRRENSSTTYEKIEDITYKKRNFFNLLLNYGDVILQTSGRSGGEDPEGVNGFVFNNVPNPEEIAQLIIEEQQASEQNNFTQAAKAHADALQKLINKKSLV
jgi:hypothetical protein